MMAAGGWVGCGKPEGAAASDRSAGPVTQSPAPASAPISLSPPGGGSPADQAWAAFQEQFSKPPEPPASWATEPPDEAAIRTFQLGRGELAQKVADTAKDFYTTFPQDERAASARWHEMQLLDAAVKLGQTNALTRLEALEKARLEDPSASEDERFGIRMTVAQRNAGMLFEKDEAAARASLEQSVQDLVREFPKRPEAYQVLLNLAGDAPPDKARAMVAGLLSTNAPEAVRSAAQDLVAKLDRVGKPMDLKFTAVDGREVDLAQLRGKVVLLDFWATWCGPCVAELPNLKAAYQRLHPKGFEIVGISFDEDKKALESFVEREKMTWPQYFDGKGWQNEFGRKFGIDAIPAMWLVDQKGILVDLNARGDLEAKVTRLLEGTPAK